ncbi:helix-turn-helix domain-containing protein [Mycobacterium sp. 94-17]|uniref:TetR/AcrR family transcriptional regulator n=1 Tax=Mycobacterium sp. 94-17 TaxID=2986147 RepID=UPI002D1F5509|nr:helix-turn-helix domain-containing protein [Mycobacterium sp. 94-17]MEB4207734.1 helix-turn-helix domain containing protein [Mycobacterium sp. 94-17]
MRSHGWSGNAPASDEEAINRILDSAEKIIEERGASMRLADVARDIGVTRQTVYRYFPGTAALMVATAMRSANGFLDQLAARMRPETDPVTAVVEGMAFAIENLADDRQVGLVLNERNDAKAGSIMTEAAVTFGRSMLHTLDVDWHQHGFTDPDLDELNEFCLRTLNSLLVDPGRPARKGAELRRFLTRWIGPAIAYPQQAAALEALRPIPAPANPRRRSRAR